MRGSSRGVAAVGLSWDLGFVVALDGVSPVLMDEWPHSDTVVQIVDARNPMLFWCPDVDDYVRDVDENKSNLLLLNKADLLTPEQR